MTSHHLHLAAGLCATAAALLAVIAAVLGVRRRGSRARAADRELDDEHRPLARWRRWVAPLAYHLGPGSPAELDALTTRLFHAGRRGRHAVLRHAEDRALAVLAGGAAAVAALVLVGRAGGIALAAATLAAGIAGPGRWLAVLAATRRDAVAAALPGAIDLLTTCIDAGLALEQALARVGRLLAPISRVLAAELAITSAEIEAGVSTADALRRLARRVGLDELSAMAGVIAQAHGLGAPIGDTLREFAAASRRARTSRLEERAGTLAAQLTLPLAVCLLPAALLIILGPAVLQLARALP
jgi:tight adherence protein C